METVAAAASARVDRPRHPERTVLYRALTHHFEHFLRGYEERFLPTHGYLRGCVEPAVHRYLDCGIFDQGVARVRCPECRHEFLVAFSCKLRGLCPSCHQKRELLWADWAEQELLEDVPHRQVVFTIPKRLRIFLRYDRKLLGELAGCAWRALKLYFSGYFDGTGVKPGAVGFVQTAGELLNFHPHVHVLITDGGFLPDGAFRPLAWFDSRHVERLFRAEVLRMFLDKELVTEATIDNLLSWRHSGFSAHGAVRVEDRKGAVRLGRYRIRCPIVLKRLSWETETGVVVCRGRPSRRGGSDGGEARWDVLEFLARVVDHIPEPSQQTVRYWGFYANAARGKRRKAALAGDAAQAPPRRDDDEFNRRAWLTWACLFAASTRSNVPLKSTFWIEHDDERFKLTRTHVWEDRWDTMGFEATTDGTARHEKSVFSESWTSVSWLEDELVLEMRLGAAGQNGTNIVHYRLEDEGRTLIAAEWFHMPGKRHHNLWVFDRAPDDFAGDDRDRVRDFAERYAAAWSSQDPVEVAGFFTENGSLGVNDDEPAVGREARAALAQGFMTDLPDMVVLFDGLEGRGERVRFCWTLEATNSGPGGTGNRVGVSGHETWRLDEAGLIAESRGSFPTDEYERQLEGGYEAPPPPE